MEFKREIVAPIVRGMSSDGETPLIVTVLDNREAELSLVAQEVNVATIEKWRSQFNTFLKEKMRYPKSVKVEGEGWALGLGRTLEEAQGAQGAPYTERIVNRGDIMRGKVSLVTGGAQGFGEGIVRGLIAEGGFAYIADMNYEGAKALANQLNSEAGREVAIPLLVNVTNEASVEAMMNQVALKTGSLDIFISNAGVLRAGSVKELSLKDFQFVTDVDYTGFFICTKFASTQMAYQNLGSGNTHLSDIIVISSKSGLEGSNKNGAYAGAKFGVIGLAQSFALELVSDNIKVNAICPGNFLDGPLWADPKNGLFVQYLEAGKVPGAKTLHDVRRAYESKVPLNRGCTTEDVVRAICYVVEQKYETGQAVPVTGGQVMLN